MRYDLGIGKILIFSNFFYSSGTFILDVNDFRPCRKQQWIAMWMNTPSCLQRPTWFSIQSQAVSTWTIFFPHAVNPSLFWLTMSFSPFFQAFIIHRDVNHVWGHWISIDFEKEEDIFAASWCNGPSDDERVWFQLCFPEAAGCFFCHAHALAGISFSTWTMDITRKLAECVWIPQTVWWKYNLIWHL